MNRSNAAKNLPPPAPKGTRTPGSGRKPGTPNKISVAFRVLVQQMVEDPVYQHRLRADFKARRVHPTVESVIWAYHVGKPKQELELSGGLELTQRYESEREKLRGLGLSELEALAAESQALIDRAFDAASNGRLLQSALQDVVVEALQDKEDAETLANTSESDNTYSDNKSPKLDDAPGSDSDDKS